jgi:hypothetical protein
MAAANRGGMRPAPGGAPWTPGPPNRAKDGGKSGRADSRNFSISASCSRFAFALLFWNQIFTCNAKEVQPSLLSDSQRFVPKSSHEGYVVDKVALGKVFSEYFCFPLPILILPTFPYSLIILLSKLNSLDNNSAVK